jgi:hypothetical protein
MITTAQLFNYRIKEFLQFVHNALMIVSQHSPDKLRVKAQYQALSKLYLQLERAYKQNTDQTLTQELRRLDAARDQAIVCLRMISEGYTRHHRANYRLAGQQVLDCIDKYGARLYNLNHSAETATLKKIAADLRADSTYTEALQLLHLKETVDEMQRTNQEFERQFVRHLQTASQAEVPRMRDLVKQTTDAYRTLVEHVAAHALLSPSPEYTLFGHHFNENVEHFNQLVARRRLTPETTAAEPTDSPAEAEETVGQE